MTNYGFSLEAACAWDGAPMVDFGGLTIGDACGCSCPEVEEPADCLTLTMYDSYGDGGGSITVNGATFTLDSGSEASFDLCGVDLSACTDVLYASTDFWPYENSWSISDADGNVLASGADANGLLGDCGVEGCTDMTACNYNVDATTDDGSCTYPISAEFDCDGNCVAGTAVVYTAGSWSYENAFVMADCDGNVLASMAEGDSAFAGCVELGDAYTITMTDSWGDGWNGGSLNVGGTDYTMDGSESVIEVGTCPVPCENVTVTCDGGSWQAEVGWTITDADGNIVAEGGAPFAGDVCLAADGCFDISMTDSYGDGWNGNVLNIGGATFGLETGSEGSDSFCMPINVGCMDETACNYDSEATIDDGSCEFVSCACDGTTVNITCDGGAWQGEVSWNLLDSDGNVVATGGAPFADVACLDLESCYSVVMNDSFGDGWNGNVLTIGDETFTLAAGSSATVEFGTCVFECDATELAVTVAGGDANFGFIVSDQDGNTVAMGGAEFEGVGCFDLDNNCYSVSLSNASGLGDTGAILTVGDDSFDWGESTSFWNSDYSEAMGGACPVYGCMDETACNYDGSADTDDGSCEYLSCACDASVITVDGGTFQNEVSWNISDCDGNVILSGFAPYEDCVELPADYVINMFDSWGDGWNGNVMSIDGSEYTIDFGLDAVAVVGSCDVEILGCIDESACNFNPDANTDDGSCTYPFADFLDCDGGFVGCSDDDVFMIINAYDSWGDGWNGNFMNIFVDGVLFDPPGFGFTYALEWWTGNADLSYAEVPFCVSADASCFDVTVDGGSFQSEVSWTISDSEGVVLEGGAPFSGSFGDCSALGCTDAAACNFDADATIDNGSCEYPESGYDCDGNVTCAFDFTTVSYDGSGAWQGENSWMISDAEGNVVWAADATNFFFEPNISADLCMDPDACYTFTLMDSFGDGWNGNSLNAGSFGTFTVNGGSMLEASNCVAECTDTEVAVYWVDATDMSGFSISDANGVAASGGADFDGFACLDLSSCYDVDLVPTGSLFDVVSTATLAVGDQTFVYNEGTNGMWSSIFIAAVGDGCGVAGCMDANACNYNADATIENFTCEYTSCAGCTDAAACNFDADATLNDGSCEYISCTCSDNTVVVGGGFWQEEVSWTITDCDGNVVVAGGAPYEGCVALPTDYVITMNDSFGDGWNGNIMTIDGSAEYTVDLGSEAVAVVGSCGGVEIPGCMDETACNFDEGANVDDGSCWYPADGYNCDLEFVGCPEGFEEYTWSAFDTFGDGWNGAEASVYVDGVLQDPAGVGYTYTLSWLFSADCFNGVQCAEQVLPVCFEEGATCFQIDVTSGTWPQEIAWNLAGPDGTELMSGIAPDSQSYGCESENLGCTDETACNFDSEATTDDGSCTYPTAGFDCDGVCAFDLTNVSYDGSGAWQGENSWTVSDSEGNVIWESNAFNWFFDPNISADLCMDPDACYTFTLFDSFGDGWNGNSLVAGSFGTFTVNGGSMVEASNCVAECEAEEVATYWMDATDMSGFSISGPDGVVASGGADFDGVACIDFSSCYDIDLVPTGSFLGAGATLVVGDQTFTYEDGSNGMWSSIFDGVIGSGCPVTGCMDLAACNFNPDAEEDDFSCTYPNECGSCEGDVSCLGCIDETACNFNADATVDDGSCDYISCGCTGTVISCDGGSWQGEVSWSIVDADGNVVASGGAPYNECDALIDFDSCYSVVMNDSFGDGWNGNILTVGDETFTLAAGSSATVELGTCVFECDATELAISVEGGDENFGFIVSDQDGNTVAMGGAGFDGVGCFDLDNNCYNVSLSNASGLGNTGAILTVGDDTFSWDSISGWTSLFPEVIGGSCPVYGCMDETACNFNADATADDASCEYLSCTCDGTTIVVDGGSWQSEVSWDITDCNGNVLASGGAPYSECLDVTLPDAYVINMFDSFGDGWNGNICLSTETSLIMEKESLL